MTGGLLQLVAIGAQDMYTSGNPQVTLFKSTYRRHTNFSVEPIEAPFNGAADWGRRVQCTVPRNGDMINRGYVQVTVPAVTVPDGKEFRWLNWLGHALIKNIEVEIGGQRLDKHYGDWLHIYNEYNQDSGKKAGYANMVGNVPALTQLYKPTGGDATVPSVTLYIPMQFWFNKNIGLSLPLIALQYHEVKINVEFRSKSECCWNPNNISVDSLTASIYFDYVFLDTEERRRTAQISHEYLIDQLQFTGDESITAEANKIKLSINHPTKAIYFVVQLDSNVTTSSTDEKKGQQWFNYTDAADKSFYTGTPSDPLGGGMAGNNSPFNHQALPLFSSGGVGADASDDVSGAAFDISDVSAGAYWGNIWHPGYSNANGNHPRIPLFDTGANPVKSAKLQLNGHDRFSEREGRYFNLVQAYQHHLNVPPTGINMYSFAYKPFEFQPTGTCNMSRIDSIVFHLRVGPAVKSAKARFYALSLNVLRVTSGMGGQAYSSTLMSGWEDLTSVDFV